MKITTVILGMLMFLQGCAVKTGAQLKYDPTCDVLYHQSHLYSSVGREEVSDALLDVVLDDTRIEDIVILSAATTLASTGISLARNTFYRAEKQAAGCAQTQHQPPAQSKKYQRNKQIREEVLR